MKFETISYEQEGAIGLLTLQRPQAMNALNRQLLTELTSFCSEIKRSRDVRALIITGAGEKAFVAGADIKEMSRMSPDEAMNFAHLRQTAFNPVEALPFAVIAAVNGFALGGGCELALSCDIIIASEKAKFGVPEVTLGLLPSFGGTQRLARSVGLFRAREMIFSGDLYSAPVCSQFGLVNSVVSPDQLLPTARKLAETIAKRGPVAIAKAKRAINTGFDLLLKEGLQQELELFAELFTTQDHREGITAFIEKRSPSFTGH